MDLFKLQEITNSYANSLCLCPMAILRIFAAICRVFFFMFTVPFIAEAFEVNWLCDNMTTL